MVAVLFSLRPSNHSPASASLQHTSLAHSVHPVSSRSTPARRCVSCSCGAQMTTITYTRTTMFPHQSPRSDTAGTHGAHDRRPYPIHHGAVPSERERPRIELPRPSEPQLSQQLHTPLSESSLQMRQDRGQPLSALPSTDMPRGPSLPGLRDILSPQSQESASSTYFSGSQPFHHHQRNDSRQSITHLHPPLVLQPPPFPQQYQSQDAPGPDLRQQQQQPHIPAASPFSPQYDPQRDVQDHRYVRHRQDSSISYSGQPQAVTSPYTPLAREEPQQYNFSPALVHDRQSGAALPPVPAPEAQGKYLGVREVPGEGQFHIYESGVRIPTYVDGEQVNPAWGLTKANKPRKRLAAACLDCRDKKIKCEPGPGNSACLQCEKAKRPCRSTSRTHNPPSNAETSSNWSVSAGSPPRSHGNSDPTPSGSKPIELDQSNRRRQREADSSSGSNVKKHRSASPVIRSQTVSNAVHSPSLSIQSAHQSAASIEYGGLWEEDPYVKDPVVTMELLDLYFACVNDAMYPLLPRRPFLDWVITARDKCPHERMTLYATIAAGSLFTPSHQAFASLAVDAVTKAVNSKEGKFSLPLAQSRFLLALYHFIRGNEGAAWDYCGAAIRVANAIRLNSEDGCLHGLKRDDKLHYEFHMSPEQVAESRRRTFWSLFLMDRLIGFCCGTQSTINPKDVFLRLPVSDEVYQGGLPSDAPLFNNGITDMSRTVLTATSHVAPVGWLVLGAAIYGDVLTFLSRSVNRAPDDYSRAYESFYHEAEMKISGWLSRLPDNLQYNQQNLERSMREGYAGAFIGIHTFHHFTVMKLNRWARHSLIPESIARNIRTAHQHARQFLEMMADVQSVNHSSVTSLEERQAKELTYINATTGYATFAAIDIVAAGGSDEGLRSIIDLIETGLGVLRTLSSLWMVAQSQHADGQMRLLQIRNIVARPVHSSSGCWLGRRWGMEKPLETEFGLEDDCIYGVADHIYFKAFSEGTRANRHSSGSVRIA
ncbi:hypothetical protein K431DRAFT_278761 [Polychaeton citri CBS 116435]|uniref:Zn(2)-C6 fungal-type domain-containing protein n=1 Tax=Polychaeton citri CBS 116435 TaxID=1314669 RepID=A0A9P4UL40_9PEZI|nr:hypothetical protein K431DRAFT_278761 [Polychaeton citri CBS 116435]